MPSRTPSCRSRCGMALTGRRGDDQQPEDGEQHQQRYGEHLAHRCKISGVDARPADEPAGVPVSPACRRCAPGAPQAMWTCPSTPMTSADRPMTIRPLASGFSGCRISRTAMAPSSIGTSRSSRPKAPVTSISTRSPTGPLQVGPGAGGDDQREAEQQQREAVLAVRRVEVLRAAPYAAEHGADGVREAEPAGRARGGRRRRSGTGAGLAARPSSPRPSWRAPSSRAAFFAGGLLRRRLLAARPPSSRARFLGPAGRT